MKYICHLIIQMNEEDLMCQQNLNMNMTAYLVTLLKLVRKTKKTVSEMKMNE